MYPKSKKALLLATFVTHLSYGDDTENLGVKKPAAPTVHNPKPKEASAPISDFKQSIDPRDLKNLFCPQILKCTNEAGCALAPPQSGGLSLLDYLRTQDQKQDATSTLREVSASLLSPIQKALIAHQELRARADENRKKAEAFEIACKNFGSSAGLQLMKDYDPNFYENDSLFSHPGLKSKYFSEEKKLDLAKEVDRLKKIRDELRAQALKDKIDIEAIGYSFDPQNSENKTKHIRPHSNYYFLMRDFVPHYREATLKAFIRAQETILAHNVSPLSKNVESEVNGKTIHLKELFHIGDEKGLKIAVDENGKYYVSSNEEKAPYDSLCNPTLNYKEIKIDAQAILRRILDTGIISLSPQECAEIRKQNNTQQAGIWLATELDRAIRNFGPNATEVLMPRETLSDELRKKVEKALPKLEESALRLNEAQKELDSIIAEIERVARDPANTPEALASFQNSATLNSPSAQDYYNVKFSEPEGRALSSELARKYPHLILKYPSLFADLSARQSELTRAQSRFQTAKTLSEGDFPLSAVQHIHQQYIGDRRSPISPTQKEMLNTYLSYESHINPETGNLEVFLAESKSDPDGLRLDTYTKLNSAPIFVVNKSNLKLTPDVEATRSDSIWGLLIKNSLHCEGDITLMNFSL